MLWVARIRDCQKDDWLSLRYAAGAEQHASNDKGLYRNGWRNRRESEPGRHDDAKGIRAPEPNGAR